MKFLRNLLLASAVTVLSFGATQAFAQQEVDPDHFDQPAAAKQAAKLPSLKAKTHTHANGKTNIASKRARQHHTRATA
jgi:hypothetical protein